MYRKKISWKLYTGVIIVFWFVYFLVFGPLQWSHFEVFDNNWWFDTAAHGIFGFCGSLNLLYIYRRYASHGAFRFSGKIFFAMGIVGQVVIFDGVLWEGFEALWDNWLQPHYFPASPLAQKGSLDTTLDPLTTLFTASITMGLWLRYNALYEKIFFNASIEHEIQKTITQMRHVSTLIHQNHVEHCTLRKFSRYLSKETRKLRHKMRRRS